MLSPDEWRKQLDKGLDSQAAGVQTYENYYDGNHPMAFATVKFRQAFGALFAALADNWCRTVVDVPVERLVIEGFRFGDDQEADKDVWKGIWQPNNLDAESVKAHTTAVKDGAAYVMVAPPPQEGDPPMITVEHPSQVIVAFAPGNRRQRIAALKRWKDEESTTYTTLYLPTEIHKWQQVKNGNAPTPREGDTSLTGANPLNVVPIIPLPNNPTMLGAGQSDLIPAMPLQDAINKEIADMLVASEFAAYRQRVLIGAEVPTDPETGQPTAQVELKAAVQRFWAIEDKDAKIAEFSAADLKNYTTAIETLLNHLAAQTRTPPHYLLGQIVNASGDALKAAETGLVAKVRRKQIDFAEGWEEAMRLAFKATGDDARANETSAQVIWRDAEYRSQGEMVDALTKLGTLGVPAEILWEKAGFTPQEIERMKTMQESESLLQAALVGQRRITVTEKANGTGDVATAEQAVGDQTQAPVAAVTTHAGA